MSVEDAPHLPQWNQTESYTVVVKTVKRESIYSLVLYTFYIDIITSGGVHMIVITLCSLLCDIIMVVYVISDHRKRQ